MTSSLTLEGLATLPTSFLDWLEYVNKITDNTDDLSNKNSFELFLSIISLSLSADCAKMEKMTKQFFGRVRTKLPPQKFSTLEERGLKNALSIYLVVVKIRRNDVSFVVDALCDTVMSLQNNGDLFNFNNHILSYFS